MANRNLLLYLLAFLPLSVSAQKLTIAKSTVDVGRTGWKQPVTAVFELKAKGKVSIEAVQPDCNCTVVDYPKGTLTDKFQIRLQPHREEGVVSHHCEGETRLCGGHHAA